MCVREKESAPGGGGEKGERDRERDRQNQPGALIKQIKGNS